jgi:hypothetical protein
MGLTRAVCVLFNVVNEGASDQYRTEVSLR